MSKYRVFSYTINAGLEVLAWSEEGARLAAARILRVHVEEIDVVEELL